MPCAACGRHVRTTEATCPFCQTARDFSVAPTRVRGTGLLDRAAVVFVSAAAVAACEREPPQMPVTLYGPPPIEASDAGAMPSESTPPKETPTADAGRAESDKAPMPVALYAAPPINPDVR